MTYELTGQIKTMCKTSEEHNIYVYTIKDMTAINDLLLKKIKFTKSFADKVIAEFGKDTIKILLTAPTKVEKIKHKTIDNEIKKLKIFTEDEKKSAISFFLSNNGISQ